MVSGWLTAPATQTTPSSPGAASTTGAEDSGSLAVTDQVLPGSTRIGRRLSTTGIRDVKLCGGLDRVVVDCGGSRAARVPRENK